MSMVKPHTQAELLCTFRMIVDDFHDEAAQLARQVENVAHYAANGEACDEDYDSTAHLVRMAAASWEGVVLAWRDIIEARS